MGLSDCRVDALLAVSDLDKARHFDQTMNDLASRGVAFERYDQPGLKTDEAGVFTAEGLRAAWVRDPDGNTLSLTEVDAA
jgi:hypothetical protein